MRFPLVSLLSVTLGSTLHATPTGQVSIQDNFDAQPPRSMANLFLPTMPGGSPRLGWEVKGREDRATDEVMILSDGAKGKFARTGYNGAAFFAADALLATGSFVTLSADIQLGTLRGTPTAGVGLGFWNDPTIGRESCAGFKGLLLDPSGALHLVEVNADGNAHVFASLPAAIDVSKPQAAALSYITNTETGEIVYASLNGQDVTAIFSTPRVFEKSVLHKAGFYGRCGASPDSTGYVDNFSISVSTTPPLAAINTYLTPYEGVYSSPIVTGTQIVKKWEPTAQAYRALSPWSAGNTVFELKTGTGESPYAEIRTDKHPVVGTLALAPAVPVADGVLNFEYRIPAGVNARELHLNLRVEEGDKRYTMRLPVSEAGKWQRESIPLAGIVGGDRWRQSKSRLATRVEIGLLVNQGPSTIQFREITISRLPSPWGPLPVPAAIPVSRAGAQRVFSIEGAPGHAWLQVVASTPVDVILNGRTLGQAGLKNYDTEKWPAAVPIPVAREFALERRHLSAGANTLVLKSSSGQATDALCALGWEAGGARNVLVSDSSWTGAGSDGAFLATQPHLSAAAGHWVQIPDIYPLRNPRVWTDPSAALPARKLSDLKHNPALTGAPGLWKTSATADGRWNLVTPEGKPLYFLGIQVLGLLPNINYRFYRTMTETYGSEAEFLTDTLAQIRRLGFNGIAPAATSGGFFQKGRETGFYNFQYIGPEAGGPFMRNHAGKNERHMADPFDQGWRERYRASAKAFAATWRDDPSMIGVYVNNEIPLEGSVNGNGLAGYIYSEACRAAFSAWLATRYGDNLDNLKKAWVSDLPAISDIKDFASVTTLDLSVRPQTALTAEEGHAAPQQFKATRGALQTDLYDFAVHAMGVYADFMLEVLREELPGKLIASNRFMGNATDEMIAAWKNYDLIGWNAYPFGLWQQGVYTKAQLDHIRRAHRITGKPIVLSETGVQALDARLPNPSAQLYTQKQRGEEYGRLLRQVHDELPFVVGFTLFAWQNLPDSERQSWGIIDDLGRPYADYATGIEKANKSLPAPISVTP
ncbi:MAG: beta-galactosidase [Opitutaceae bacterium]|jgi:hypothetical protein